MKNKDIYGFEVTDVMGGFKRWFGSDTIRYKPMMIDLEALCMIQINREFIEAYHLCKKEAIKNGFGFKTLTEEDFKATPNPVKKFFNKIFGRKA